MIGLLPFQDNLSYFAIDLDRMLRQRPEAIREMFAGSDRSISRPGTFGRCRSRSFQPSDVGRRLAVHVTTKKHRQGGGLPCIRETATVPGSPAEVARDPKLCQPENRIRSPMRRTWSLADSDRSGPANGSLVGRPGRPPHRAPCRAANHRPTAKCRSNHCARRGADMAVLQGDVA